MMCSFVQLSTCLKYSSYYCLLAIMKEIKKHILYHVNHHFFFHVCYTDRSYTIWVVDTVFSKHLLVHDHCKLHSASVPVRSLSMWVRNNNNRYSGVFWSNMSQLLHAKSSKHKCFDVVNLNQFFVSKNVRCQIFLKFTL